MLCARRIKLPYDGSCGYLELVEKYPERIAVSIDATKSIEEVVEGGASAFSGTLPKIFILQKIGE